MPSGDGQPAVASRVLAHYARTAALLDASFAGSAIVFADFPRGFHAKPRLRITQIPLSQARIGWLVQREYAVEFHGWAPREGEPERLRYGRVVLDPPRGEHGFRSICSAALVLREELQASGYDAIPVLDGLGGIVLWLPFAEAPPAAKVRAKLGRFCARVAALHGGIFCTGALPSETRIHLDASVNAPGHYSVLPYSLRGTPALPVATPVTWNEIAGLRAPVICTAETWPQRFAACGDLFATGSEALHAQRLRTRATSSAQSYQ
jgi:DNA primase